MNGGKQGGTDSAPVSAKPDLPAEPNQPKRLRIAVLNRIFSPTGGGAERYSIALVEQLTQRHEIHVFAQQIEHQWPGVVYHKIPAPFVKPRWINQLWFAVATWWQTRRGFDVVHSHENTWHGEVQTVHVVPVKHSLLAGREGWRLVLRWLKILTSPRLLAYLALERFRYIANGRRCIVLASNSLRPVMAKAYPAAINAVRVVTPGVASIHGCISAEDKLAARHKLGLPQVGHCILFVGNDYRKKGLPALVAAVAELPRDCFLAVVGNSAQTAGLKAELKSCNHWDRIFFLGALSAVDDAYRAADCLAHPTLEDTFAMVVLEAMSYGLPVVVSSGAYCGIAELLLDGTDALVLNDPREHQELAKAIDRVLFDAKLAQRLADHGLRFARQYLWSEIARQQEKIYFSVAAST